MKNKIIKSKDITPIAVKDYLLNVAASPPVQALSQFNPISAAVNSLFSGEYNRKKQEEITEALHKLHSRLQSVEKRYVDKEFYTTEKGKRVFAMALASLIKDSRKQKIEAMSNLLVNLTLKSKITYDERELFVDILDALNPFHLTVLGRIYEFNKESKPSLRKFETAGIASFFEDKGIDSQLTHQAIAVLANHYLVNRGTDATIGGGGLTYHFTEFGERFFVFISEVLQKDSPYLKHI